MLRRCLDPRTKDWPMMSSPFPTLAVCLGYVYLVKVSRPHIILFANQLNFTPVAQTFVALCGVTLRTDQFGGIKWTGEIQKPVIPPQLIYTCFVLFFFLLGRTGDRTAVHGEPKTIPATEYSHRVQLCPSHFQRMAVLRGKSIQIQLLLRTSSIYHRISINHRNLPCICIVFINCENFLGSPHNFCSDPAIWRSFVCVCVWFFQMFCFSSIPSPPKTMNLNVRQKNTTCTNHTCLQLDTHTHTLTQPVLDGRLVGRI